MDISLSVGLMIVALPAIIAAALAVTLTSPGPILFKQQRVGQDGRNFIVLKFRTMVAGSEKGDRYTAKKDARITKVGAFMRTSRLDELPQLWNVLRGDMSFIGPRAEWDELGSTESPTSDVRRRRQDSDMQGERERSRFFSDVGRRGGELPYTVPKVATTDSGERSRKAW